MLVVGKNVLKKLDPEYLKEMEKIEIALKKKKINYSVIKKLLVEFSQNYFMLPELWEQLFIAANKVISLQYKDRPSSRYYYHRKEEEIWRIRSRKQFYSNPKEGSNENFGFVKLFEESPNLHNEFVDCQKIKEESNLPRKELDETWKHFNEYSSSPLPREAFLMYEKSKNLYEEISATSKIAAAPESASNKSVPYKLRDRSGLKSKYALLIVSEDQTQKWFNLICQVNDAEYVCNNVEYRIGNDVTNCNLWKLYLNYLKENDTKRLLYVYSCYCRFFNDDVEMKEEYKNACEIHGPSLVSWKNTYDFEIFEKDMNFDEEVTRKKKKVEEDEDEDESDEEELPTKSDHKKRLITEPKLNSNQKINIKNYRRQIFTFPKTTMDFIIKNDNVKILNKLHQTCKYFFAVLPYPACHSLFLTKRDHESDVPYYVEFFQQSIWVSYTPSNDTKSSNGSNDLENEPSTKLFFDQKFVISNAFHCIDRRSEGLLSDFIPNIYQCYAKYIRITDQYLTFNELKVLIGNGNVEVLQLERVEIVHENDDQNDNKDDDDKEVEKVELEKILQLTPKILEFEIDSPTITDQTFQILSEMDFKNKLVGPTAGFKNYNPPNQVCRELTYLEPFGFAEFLKKNLDSKSNCYAKFKYNSVAAQQAIDKIKRKLENYWKKSEQPKIRIHHYSKYEQRLQIGG